MKAYKQTAIIWGNVVSIGSRIREARERAELTQPELGEICGWGKDSQSRISHYERNINEPTLSDIEKIARATGQDAAWIAFGDVSLAKDEQAILSAYRSADERGKSFIRSACGVAQPKLANKNQKRGK